MPVKMQLLRVFISAKAGNLDIEQLDQRGSVKLHLIKRVTAVQSYCSVLLCIANKPGFKNRETGDGSTKLLCASPSKQHQDPTLSFLPCPRCCSGTERREEAAFAAVEVWHRCPALFPHPTEATGPLQGPLRWVHPTLSPWAGHGAVAPCPRQSLQCHTWEFPVCHIVFPLCSQQGMGLAQLQLQGSTTESTSPGAGAASCLSAGGLSRFLTFGLIKVGIKHPKHSSSKTAKQVCSSARSAPSGCFVLFWEGSLQVWGDQQSWCE